MSHLFKLLRSVAVVVASGAVLVGCVQQPKTLYQWEGYEPQVYQYFKGESKEAQLVVLEADLEKMKATNRAAPPGYHAHMGMLYGSLGQDDQMVQQLQTEKALFPESAAYMDFLLSNAQKGSKP
ncbi:hypothetical protein AWM79_05215 [Pseudomonas agarici]|uniref:DUF4810 domain-containing protein n=1 Tax=Pseudomonas agarici TaxID=46677 RepID=A0A0X1SYF0_PSEAA|nr:DUF4810 domain-containing protein [Pseudomonas agarici]AMB84740.1 hypothetical protein AWM79_05215 [Pseudomonas agarici]NWB93865.1 DUF4810 domain-containing protein [Pseudomonas agarici]NWC09992.1 DUF4810 domain-containing protein [Pseudomonas agarici]SEL55193.1 hypothetical protein SAMN05216604_1224 [Pseudomonas agarici]